MGPELAVAIAALGVAMAGTGLSVASSMEQNKRIKDQMLAQRKAAAVQAKQVQDSAALEKQKLAREAQQIRGRIRTVAAGQGVGIDGSFAALTRQTTFDAGLNTQIVTRNTNNQLAYIQAGSDAKMAELQAQQRNPIIEGFQGLLQGASTGLSMASAGLSIKESLSKPQTGTAAAASMPTGYHVF